MRTLILLGYLVFYGGIGWLASKVVVWNFGNSAKVASEVLLDSQLQSDSKTRDDLGIEDSGQLLTSAQRAKTSASPQPLIISHDPVISLHLRDALKKKRHRERQVSNQTVIWNRKKEISGSTGPDRAGSMTNPIFIEQKTR